MITQVKRGAPTPLASARPAWRRAARKRGPQWLLLAGLTALACVWLVPIVFVVLTAMRPEGDLTSHGVFSWPGAVRWANLTDAWQTGDFSTVYKNSVIVTAVKVPLGILIASLAAFPLAKIRFRFRQSLFLYFLLGLAIPVHVTLLPLFIILKNLGILDTLWSLFPPYLAFGMPLEIFILRGFLITIPSELIEAARIDGASEFGIYWRILMPLIMPAVATLCVIDAVATWNEFLIALIMLNSAQSRTLPLGLLYFSGEHSQTLSLLNAGILIVVLPLLVLYVLLQRYLISGLTSGAVKG